MKICVDAGHGGNDPGAVTERDGEKILEKELALSYALALQPLLEANGHEVLLTRSKDLFVFPGARLRMAMKWKADVFVSLHCNSAASPLAHGMEVIYRDENDLLLAQRIYESLLGRMEKIIGRGLKNDQRDLGRSLAVLGDIPLPACLVEVGFLSNEEDLHEIERVDAVSQGISDGIEGYCELLRIGDGRTR